MVMQNYEQLVGKIAKSSGLNVSEVMQKVEAKCAKLSGLISKEGSAQIVASELGVNLDKEKLKVKELVDGMRKLSVIGKIIQEPQIREFTTKGGLQSKVLSSVLADDTGNLRLVLWDENHISLFEDGKLKKDQVVEISNASIRNNELHLGSFSEIKQSEEVIENVILGKQVVEKSIGELKAGESVKLRAVVAQIYTPKFFEVSKDTGRKITEDEKGRGVESEKRALLGVVLDDGSENMRAVMFGEQIKELGFIDTELNDEGLFITKKNSVLGSEMFFDCNVRNNAMFNTTELIINGMEDINLDNLIESLKE
ncbi:MAG: hypothetical protein U9Q06_01460 [Nanoarchaeota archaeon]|nr:hypothetical protein [Nanoarchaeota archaeon]